MNTNQPNVNPITNIPSHNIPSPLKKELTLEQRVKAIQAQPVHKDKAGQPTKYRPEYCQLVIEHMSAGLSMESFAGLIEIAESTLFDWIKLFPEFKEAVHVGRAKSRIFWEQMGIGGAVGQIDKFNASSWIFNMKNRFNWRDKQDITTDGEAILPDPLLDARSLKAMMKMMMAATPKEITEAEIVANSTLPNKT